jgi:hypothetical protein
MLRANGKDIRIERSRSDMFRWTVTVEGRTRVAVSVVAVLRQVREALEPGYGANRIRVVLGPPAQPG